MLITIDGPSGVGKGTVAKIISSRLGIQYLDSGAMYRALALFADLKGIKCDDDIRLKRLIIDIHIQFIKDDNGEDRVMLNADDVTEDIRTNEISKLASEYASIEIVRGVLREMQKRLVRKGLYCLVEISEHMFFLIRLKILFRCRSRGKSKLLNS